MRNLTNSENEYTIGRNLSNSNGDIQTYTLSATLPVVYTENTDSASIISLKGLNGFTANKVIKVNSAGDALEYADDSVVDLTTAVNFGTSAGSLTTFGNSSQITKIDGNINLSGTIFTQTFFDNTIKIGNGNSSQGFVQFQEKNTNGSNYVILQPPASLADNYTLTLPIPSSGTTGTIALQSEIRTDAQIRGLFSGTSPVSFNSGTGAISLTGLSGFTANKIIKVNSAGDALEYADDNDTNYWDLSSNNLNLYPKENTYNVFIGNKDYNNTNNVEFVVAGDMEITDKMYSGSDSEIYIQWRDTNGVELYARDTGSGKSYNMAFRNSGQAGSGKAYPYIGCAGTNGSSLAIFITNESTTHTLFNSDLSTTHNGNLVCNNNISVKNGSSTSGSVSFFEDDSFGSNSIKLQAPLTAIGSDKILTLPDATATLATTDDVRTDAEIRGLFSGTSPISYTSGTGAISLTGLSGFTANKFIKVNSAGDALEYADDNDTNYWELNSVSLTPTSDTYNVIIGQKTNANANNVELLVYGDAEIKQKLFSSSDSEIYLNFDTTYGVKCFGKYYTPNSTSYNMSFQNTQTSSTYPFIGVSNTGDFVVHINGVGDALEVKINRDINVVAGDIVGNTASQYTKTRMNDIYCNGVYSEGLVAKIAGVGGHVLLYENPTNGSSYTKIKAMDSIGSTNTLTLPEYTGNLIIDSQPLSITPSNSSSFYIATMLAASISDGAYVEMVLGKANSTKNCATWAYYHSSDGANANFSQFGMKGQETAITIKGDGTTTITNGATTNKITAINTASNIIESNATYGWELSGANSTYSFALKNGTSTYMYMGSPSATTPFQQHINGVGDSYLCTNGRHHNFIGEYFSTNSTSINGTAEVMGFTTYLAAAYASTRFPVLATNGQYLYVSIYNNIGGRTGGTYCGYIGSSGFVDISDKRFKKDITTITNPFDIINNIRGVNYKWNEASGKEDGVEHIGFIAQELNEVIPQVCNYDEKTDSWGIYKADINAVLVEGMKELKKQVEEQQKQINQQQVIIDKLLSSNSFKDFKS